MDTRRWNAARIAKLWLDVGLVVVLVGGGLLIGWLCLAPLLWDSGWERDLNVQVAVGDGALLPVMRLEVQPPQHGLPVIRQVRLVGTTGELRAVTGSLGLHLASMGVYAGAIVLVAWVLWSIREVLRAALDGSPFARRNARHLRRSGLLLLIGSVAWPLAQYTLARVILHRIVVNEVPLSPTIAWSSDPMLIGLLLLVLAAIFSHGADLEDERALTV